jgi:hypothetical protein
MVFHLKFACDVGWSLSGAKNGPGIGKTLNTARSAARPVNKDCAETLIRD